MFDRWNTALDDLHRNNEMLGDPQMLNELVNGIAIELETYKRGE